MKATMIAGVLLLALGIVSLAYEGISYTTQKDIVDIGPIKATKTEEKTIPIPPIVGALALAGGIGLILAGRRS